MHISVILLFNVHNNVSKFDRVTNIKRAKREEEPSGVPVEILMKAQKNINNARGLKHL